MRQQRRRLLPLRSTPTAHSSHPAPHRLWWLPLALAVAIALLFLTATNLAFGLFARKDMGTVPTPVQPAPVPQQAALNAALAFVRSATCLPGSLSVERQPTLQRASWEMRVSAADPHRYFVAAADPTTQHLLDIWVVEGGQVATVAGSLCPGLPRAPTTEVTEAAVLFTPQGS